MRRMLFTAFALCIFSTTFAQTTTDKKIKNTKWKQGGIFSLVGAQSGTRNWTAAPEKFSLTGAANLYLFANKTWGKSTWDNNLELAYALTNTESNGIRKIDDKIDLFSRYGYFFKDKLGVGIVGGFRTQFSNRYDYSEEPRKRLSGFFAPAYITASPGLQYKPFKDLTLTLGPGVRWVIVTNNPYSYNYQGGIKPGGEQEISTAEVYGVHPEEKTRFEFGPHFTATYNRSVIKNVNYRTRLDIMIDVVGNDVGNDETGIIKARQPGNGDIYWTNAITMSVNKWLKVNYGFDLIYDDDVQIFGDNKDKPATQLKSMLGVGLAIGF